MVVATILFLPALIAALWLVERRAHQLCIRDMRRAQRQARLKYAGYLSTFKRDGGKL